MAARRGGLGGRLRWKEVDLPVGDGGGGLEGESSPAFGILVIAKH